MRDPRSPDCSRWLALLGLVLITTACTPTPGGSGEPAGDAEQPAPADAAAPADQGGAPADLGSAPDQGGGPDQGDVADTGVTDAAIDPDASAADPDMAAPDMAAPDMAAPDMAAPDMAAPDMAAPDMAAPDMAAPDMAAPDMAPPPMLGNPLLPAAVNESCALPPAPQPGAFRFERAFPALSFNRPLWFGVAPGDRDTLFVVEQGGRIWAFDDRPDVDDRALFLELAVLRNNNEEGLLGLAFHPEYPVNGRFFVYYSAQGEPCPPGAARCSVVSEFQRADRRAADPESEVVLMVIPQPFGNHNGGDLRFGPDGYLYISVGDGGSAGDPLGSGQDPSTLLGSVLRIDIDGEPGEAPPPDDEPLCSDECQYRGDNDCDDGGPDSDFSLCAYGTDCTDCGPRLPLQQGPRVYGIPPDNPFADGDGGAPEVWAWGIRNIWRMDFDPTTGLLWGADVGQNRFEEISVLTGPGNYGWNVLEGNECYGPVADCDRDGMIPPIWVYPHAQGRSVTGGPVYRGPRLPELWGRYLFADYVSDRVWALTPPAGPVAPEVVQLGSLDSVTHIGADADGRVYFTTFSRNRPLARLVRAEEPEGPPFPRLLSETGCFADLVEHTMAPGVVPYQVNRPFWSDGAAKLRYVALPEGTEITARPEGGYRFPVGAVLIKTFLLDVAGEDAPRRISTRLYTRQEDGWRGFTYRWNADLSDGVLLDGAETMAFEGRDGPQTWLYPSRVECDQCHTAASGNALGWRTRQLDGVFELDGVQYSQLDALAEAGVLALPEDLPRIAHPRPGAGPLEAEARAALDVNCASCHQPSGGANATLDLRAQTPLAETGLCAPPGQGDLGVADARLIAPGDRARSVAWLRMGRRDGEGMPPIGSSVIDRATVELVGRWIDQLEGCP